MKGEDRMGPRGEQIPFAFVAEVERFRSNVVPPPAPRPSRLQVVRRLVGGLAVVAGLIGATVLGAHGLGKNESASFTGPGVVASTAHR
jgi:hypothetical protein